MNLIYNKLENLISSAPLRAAQYEDSSYKIKNYRWKQFFKSSLYRYCRNLAIIALIQALINPNSQININYYVESMLPAMTWINNRGIC